MADTTFSSGTVITSDWLNDVNDKVYEELLSATDDQFGADPTGVSDSTAALTAFFAAVAASTHKTGSIPEGTYRVNSGLTLSDASLERHDGIKIRGAGVNKTRILSYGSGTMLTVRGIPPVDGSTTQTGSYFFWGLELSDMTFDGTNKTGTLDCMQLYGVWNSEFNNLAITKMRHGIISDGDAAYNSNPDWSSTTNIKCRNIEFSRLSGWGFYNSVTQAAPGFTFEHCMFVLCSAGGALVSSGGVRLTECAFAGCGWESEAATPTANAVGLRFQGSVTATSQNTVENCEFDTNFAAHVDLVYAGSIRFAGNRYIFNDRYTYGGVCPTVGAVRFAPVSSSDAVQNVTFTGDVFRLDSGPTTGTPICYNFINNANVQNLRVVGASFSDNNGSLAFTKVSGHTTSNYWVRNSYEFKLDDLSDLGQTIVGRPLAEYIGVINGTPSTTGGNVETVLKFDTRDSVNSQIFGTTLYNTATGKFTCPVPGYYEVEWDVALVASLTTDYNAFRVYKNTTLQNEWPGAGTGGARTKYMGRRRVWCDAGDTLDLREVCSVSRVITGSYSYLRIGLVR